MTIETDTGLPYFTQLIADTASDAMSGALDMGVGISELSDAASIEIAGELHEIISEEMIRLGKLFGEGANVTFMINPDMANLSYAVALLVRPKASGGSHLVWGKTVPAAIAAVEAYSAVWADSNRTMTADDIGVEMAA